MGFALLLGILLCAACSGARSADPTAEAQEIPGSQLGPGGSFGYFDAIIDDRQTLHVLWNELQTRESPTKGITFHNTLWYQHGSAFGMTWEAPVRICESEPLQARLVDCAGQLHILVGYHIRDFISRDRGKSWQEGSPLLPESDYGTHYAQQFDVTVADSSLFIAFADTHGRNLLGRIRNDSTDLWLVSRSQARTTTPTLIGSAEGAELGRSGPRLRFSHGALVAVCGLAWARDTVKVGPDGRKFTHASDEGNVALFQSHDAGIHWSASEYLPRPNNGASHWETIYQVELMTIRDHLLLAFESGGAVHTAPITSAGIGRTAWQQPVVVQLMNATNSHAVGLSSGPSGGVIAWIAPNKQTKGSPLLDMVRRWPSELDVAMFKTVGDSLRLSAPRRLTTAVNEVTATRLINAQASDMILWSETRLGPLVLGGRRNGSSIRFARVGAPR